MSRLDEGMGKPINPALIELAFCLLHKQSMDAQSIL
jgi:hypothetical protein